MAIGSNKTGGVGIGGCTSVVTVPGLGQWVQANDDATVTTTQLAAGMRNPSAVTAATFHWLDLRSFGGGASFVYAQARISRTGTTVTSPVVGIVGAYLATGSSTVAITDPTAAQDGTYRFVRLDGLTMAATGMTLNFPALTTSNTMYDSTWWYSARSDNYGAGFGNLGTLATPTLGAHYVGVFVMTAGATNATPVTAMPVDLLFTNQTQVQPA